MKLANSLRWLAITAVTLSLGLTGCSKKPTNLTTLGGTGPGAITDDGGGKPIDNGNRLNNTPPVISGNPPGTGTTPEGLKAAPGDWDKWKADPEMFRDQTVYFDFDKATVKPSEVGKLKQVASRMKGMPGKALRIEGHADERGTEEYNRTLGDKRAQAIREFLAKEGFDAAMMPTITYGEDKPAVPGHDEAAWSKNRRGELILLSP